jgi:benzoylformate decarboxylase
LCGQQHNELVTQEPLLASNLVQIVSQFTKWAHELRSWEESALVLQRAFKEAMAPPTGPVFVAFPWEFSIHRVDPDDRVRGVTRIPPRFTADPMAIRNATEQLTKARQPVIVAGDAVGYSGAWKELQQLAQLLGAPVYLQGQSSVANFPNNDYHWQGELPGSQKEIQDRLKIHDVAFLCGFSNQAQITVFKYSDGPLIPESVRQIYLDDNTWDIGKNHFGEVGILGDVKATLPLLNANLMKEAALGSEERNAELQGYASTRWTLWEEYAKKVESQEPIRSVVVARALRELILEYDLKKRFVYVHEAVSEAAPLQLFLPLAEPFSEPISYYSVSGGSLGWSMPASLGIKLAGRGHQGIDADLVFNAVGDGSALFYPQVWWTAAHCRLPILHIIMNNREYRTLIQGLQTVVSAYSGDPEYGWEPVTTNPDYLQIRDPELNFIDLAKAFGIQAGQRVRRAAEVKDALRAGIDCVLRDRKSFVVEVFSDPEPTPDQPHIPPPPLDIYYHKRMRLL